MRSPLLVLTALASILVGLWSAPPAAALPTSFDAPTGSLDAFHASLLRARAGRGVARVIVYGASHTADDSYTAALRSLLQRRYGDGGPGWLMPAAPFAFYDHRGVEFSGRGFSGAFVRGRRREPGVYGLAGFALDGRAGASARVTSAETVERVAVHYLQQPGGGGLEVSFGDAAPLRIDTRGSLAPRRVEREGGAWRTLRLRVDTGSVRVLGVTLENASGVVVDNFGVPGARVWDQEPWRLDAERGAARARPADLLVLAYGTNESANARVPMADLRRRERAALARMRGLYPEASCLLIGPGDWPRRGRHGQLVPRPRLLAVREAQRRIARERGCAFFDTYAFMGGAGSMARWMAEGLALGDHAHFSEQGSRRLGRALYRSLTEGMPR